MDDPVSILCIDDEPNVLKSLQRLFIDEDYTILTAASGAEGLDLLNRASPVQIVISDYRMPGMDGVELLKRVRVNWPDTVRIVLSGYADTASVLAAINEGEIYKFIPKPWNDDDIRVTVANALERYRLQKQNTELAEHLTRKSDEFRKLNETLQWIISEKASEMSFQSKVFEFFQNVFQALPVAALCVNRAGHIIQTNKKAKEYLSRAGAGLVGRARSAALPDEWNRFIDAVLERTAHAARLSTENSIIDAKGAYVKFSDAEDGVILIFNPLE